jgi:hypothetical protein
MGPSGIEPRAALTAFGFGLQSGGPAWRQIYRTDWLLTGTHGFQLVGTCMGVSGNDMGWREGDSGMSSG